MISNIEYDFANLTQKVSGLSGALLGRGASEGDIEKLLKTEIGQLAGRMGDAVGPRTKEKADRRIEHDIKQYLTVLPVYSNLDESQSESSTADFTWLYASPTALVGINDEDNQISATGADALQMLRAGQKAGSRGAAWIDNGHRGGKEQNQKIMILNRTRVSKSSMNYVRATIRQKTGELRAACYRVAVKFVPTKRVPNWILSKFDQVVANGKSSDNSGGLGTPEAFIEFAIRAPGVTRNASISAKFTGAIQQSQEIIKSKFNKILKGYKYDWETGKVFRSTAGSVEDN